MTHFENLPSRLARRSLQRHWRYSLSAVLAVALGFVSLTLFRAYMQDVAWLYEDTYAHRGMYANVLIERQATAAQRKSAPWEYALTPDLQTEIDTFLKSAPEVENRVRFLTGTGLISNGTTQVIFFAKGYDLAEGTRLRAPTWSWDASHGLPLDKSEDASPVLIGKGLARMLGCTIPPGKTLSSKGGYEPIARAFDCPNRDLQLAVSTQTGQANAVTVHLSGLTNGIFKELDQKYVLAPLPVLQKLYDTRSISFVSVSTKPHTTKQFLHRLERYISDKKLPLIASDWKDHREGDMYRRTMDLLRIFRDFVISILIVITGLSVFNTFLKIVKERTREIGTLRSLGFTPRTLLSLFCLEAGYLSAIGILLGIALSIGTSAAINHAGIFYKAGILAEPVLFRIAYSPTVYLTSGLFLGAVAITASAIAATGTVRAKISDNLSHV